MVAYIFHLVGTNYIKVGMTGNPEQRLAAIRHQLPMPCKPLYWIVAPEMKNRDERGLVARKAERFLIKGLRDYSAQPHRRQCEWFLVPEHETVLSALLSQLSAEYVSHRIIKVDEDKEGLPT